jgi:hypothetical protein
MMYHALITFVGTGIPSSTGSYLYAVVTCEVVLICAASPRGAAALAGLFLLLEAYATHFVALPYYTGLIRHRADTTLEVFHVSQAVDLGLGELASRLGTLGSVTWVGFVISSAGLFLLATVIGYRNSSNVYGGWSWIVDSLSGKPRSRPASPQD